MERVERIVFQAERVEADDGQTAVRFRYVTDGSVELVISPEWWEQMGTPDVLEVAFRPYPE